MALLKPLRSVTQRLNSTPVDDLPQYVGELALTISNCNASLHSIDNKKNDESVQVHKLVTRISSLLQDRTQEGRFTGVVLCKALVEAGEPHVLTTSGSTWARALISCMGRPDPPQLKQLFILTITRIFLITRENPARIREITTPLLPAFMNACLNAIKPTTFLKNEVEKQIPTLLLRPILQSWAQLMKCFSPTFRPFLPSIRGIMLSLMSQPSISVDVKSTAAQVFAPLHFCAPKDSSGSEWIQSVRSTIEATHQAADLIFRSVIEEWTSTTSRVGVSVSGRKAANELHAAAADAIGMDKWTGLQAGSSRVMELLRLLRALVVSQHAQTVTIPLADILNLTARLVAVVPPTSNYALRENKEIGRDEREELYLNMPLIHCLVLELSKSMAVTYGPALVPLSRPFLSQVWDLLDSATFQAEMRAALYASFEVFLQSGVVSLETVDVEQITNLVGKCCSDLLAAKGKHLSSNDDAKTLQNGAMNLNTQAHGKREIILNQIDTPLVKAAWSLLPVLLSSLPTQLLTSNTRAELDRTSILLGHEQAMQTSVMNPATPRNGSRAQSSIIPFLAHTGKGLAFEAFMRPRNPTLRNAGQSLIVDDTTEAGERMTQEEDALADSNLQVVTAHVAQQLESNTPLDDSDVQSIRKRDHSELEETTQPVATEQSKRARTKSPINVSVKMTGTAPLKALVDGVEIEAESGFIDEESAPEVPPTVVTPHENNAVFSAVGGHLNKKGEAHINNFDNDDSDDSEIPMIDTALSSDEDDEMED